MPKCAFPGTVEIVDTEEKAVAACAYLMAQSALGFDTETRPSFKAGVSNRTALLQLASADRCFLFRLSQMILPESDRMVPISSFIITKF